MDHDELPRISLPSMRVWLRIKADFAQQVHARAEQHAKYLPPARREQLLKAAQQYVDQWSTIARPIFASTGATLTPSNRTSKTRKPFDEALDRKIWALAGSRLEWHRKIAQERREKPISLEHTLQELVKEHESLDADLDMEEPSLPDEDDDGLQVDVDDAVMGQIFAVAGELAQSLPTQQERSERSRAVEAEYRALKP
ncbi:hypothetical protein B0H14DRAFT_2753708 [Mycena olivaceomarginata]|nr:hypothetical protein B0H14DRAFT_2753708 [Mycena olivaceomarginata]